VYTTDKSHQSFLQKRDTNDIYYGYKLARCDVDEKTKNFILRVLVLGSSVWCLYDPMALPARYALGRSYYTHTMIVPREARSVYRMLLPYLYLCCCSTLSNGRCIMRACHSWERKFGFYAQAKITVNENGENHNTNWSDSLTNLTLKL
jgi:hypothetical protein